ncbi:MAG TPA: glycosyltransferase family 4 protein [Myxococcota bacterium]
MIPKPSLSGGLKVVRRFSDDLVTRGHRVRIYFPMASDPLPPPYRVRTFARAALQRARALGRDPTELHTMFTGTRADIVPCRGLQVAASDVAAADVVVATWWETRAWMAQWPARVGAPVYFVQGWDADISANDAERVLATYRLPGAIVTVSHSLSARLRERAGRDDARFVGLGLDEQFHAPPRGRQRRPTVGVLVSSHPLKGTALAFRALKRVEEQFPYLHVIAFGIEKLAPFPVMPSSLEWIVRPPQSEIPGIHARCDVWLTASKSEGLGLPGLEAAGCGCPLVSTRCGGPEEYLTEGDNGFFCDVDDERGMSAAIARVLSSDEAAWRRMSERSVARARALSWPAAVDRMERELANAVR